MAPKQGRQQRRRAARSQGRRLLWPLVGATVLAIAVVAVLVIVGQRGPAAPTSSDLAQGRTKGSATAAVQVDEWGDFQ